MKKYSLSWYTTTQDPREPARHIEFDASSLKNATLKALVFWNRCRAEEIRPLSEIISVQGNCWATLSDETGLIRAWMKSEDGKNFHWVTK